MSSFHRTIVVMRHAKAEQAGPTDFERELAARGVVDAVDAGGWLAGLGVVPDHALVSAATRTSQTWDAVAAAAGWTVRPELDRGLYAADEVTALDLLRLVDDAVTVLVVVGHNPTMASLVQLLDDGEGDPTVGNDLLLGFPTAATAVLTFDGSWADLATGSARATAYHVGRG